VIPPSISNVGSGPIENIKRRMVDATNVRTPDCRGSVMTMAADTIMIAQIRADKCVLSSESKSYFINCFLKRDIQ
jgi:hypothetical protein